MKRDDSEFVTREEAGRLWRRAARLQAEAAVKAESLAEERPTDPAAEQPEGYALDDVRAAAEEVGISREFVDAALTDLRARRALPARTGERSLARRFLGDPPDTLVATRVIEADPRTILTAMETIFPHAPFRLTLTDQQGDPLDGGVLVFDIQGMASRFPQDFALEARAGRMRELFITIRPIDRDPASCEVTARSPLAWSRKSDLVVGSVLSGLSGAFGFGIGTAWVTIAVGLTAPTGLGTVATALAGVIIAATTVGGSGLGVKGYRAFYRKGLGRGQRALEGLLGAVAGRAQGGWAVAPASASEPPVELPFTK